MSFFRKMGSRLLDVADKAFDALGDSIGDLVVKRYPDINEVVDTLDSMKSRVRERYPEAIDNDGNGVADDGKWRPTLLTLALLYKLQRIRDGHEESWYNRDSIFIRDDDLEKRLMHTFGIITANLMLAF